MTGSPDTVTLPLPGAQHPVEVEDEGRLAGAVRPEEGHPLPQVDVEVDAEERLVPAGVGVGDTAQVEDGDAHPARTARLTAPATAAGARARAHCAGVAARTAVTGSRPFHPRLTIARCTRSPRS